MNLHERLEQNYGKKVSIMGVKGGQIFEIGGRVEQDGDDYVLVTEQQEQRQVIGADPRTGEPVFGPEVRVQPGYRMYLNGIEDESVVVFRVFDEVKKPEQERLVKPVSFTSALMQPKQ